MKILSRLCSVLFGVVAIIFLVAGLWAGERAPAAQSGITFTVDTQLDLIDADTTDGICTAGICSLRAAIMQANVLTGPGVTIVVPPGTYTLTRPPMGANGPDNGDLNLTTPSIGSPLISIVGAGAGATFVDANYIDRVLVVQSGRRAAISGLTIRHGLVLSPGSGGGIYNTGTLTLTQVTLDHNQARFGGGITNSSGTPGSLTVNRCTLDANQAEVGGGLDNRSGTLSVTQSTISGNTATNFGGGIFNSSSQMATLIQSTLSSNSANGTNANADGGGICNVSGNLVVINSTLSQNSANNNGGGIWNSGLVNIYSSSVVFNLADADHDQNGGIGGGIWNHSSGTFNLRHVLVAGNTATDPQAGFDDCTGTLNAYGWNLFRAVNACTVNPQSTWGTLSSLADLGPLQNNGGPTLTHALRVSSNPIGNPIDSGGLAAACVDNNSIPLTTDQRGAPRTVDGDQDGVARCDIGAFEVQASTLGNISTRLRVETGDNVLIGGFIITGTQPKKMIIRAIGPSLSSFFPGALADPILELRNSSGGLIASNDNWRSAQGAEIIATTIPPSNDLESAIVVTLPANNAAYTAIVRGVNDGTGIGVVEGYDLDQAVDSKLANISTRGLVQTGDNVLIGGLIVLGQNPLRVIVRAIGPSLPVPGALGDPTLELHDGNGALIASNDNWRSDQQAEIIATGIPPSNDLESAIVRNLMPGNYTAIVRGANNTTGVALFEAYGLN